MYNNVNNSKELCYQLTLRKFSNFDSIKLSSPLPLTDLILIALNIPEVGWSEEDGDKYSIATVIHFIVILFFNDHSLPSK